MRTPTCLALLLLLPAAATARSSGLPRLGDFTAGGGLAGTAQPLEPGSPDTLLSPALTGEFNLLTPIFLTAGVNGRVDAMGPAIGWDVSLGGVIGGGTTLHGNGRTSADLLLGLPLPVLSDGWYLDLYARGGPYLDETGEGYGLLGISVKYSSWLDRIEKKSSKHPPPKKKQPKKKKKPRPVAPPPPRPSDGEGDGDGNDDGDRDGDGGGYEPRPRPDPRPDFKPRPQPDGRPGTKPLPPPPAPRPT